MSTEEFKKIEYEWKLRCSNNTGYRNSTMHSGCFSSSNPPVQFNILSGVHDDRFSVVISKTPHNPANIIIEILIRNVSKTKLVVNDWTKVYVIDDMDFGYFDDGYHRSESFKCIITWMGWVKILPPPQIINLYTNTKKLLSTPDFTDITINVNSEEIPAHKVILAVQSPVFSAMFQTNMKESANNQIDITDFDIDTVKKMVEFLYTGKLDVNLNVDLLLSILAAAEKYQIIELKYLCEKYLRKKIDLDTALKILEEASLYGVPQLIEQTITFMVDHKTSIAQLEGFEDLLCRKPALFFEFIVRLIGE